MSLMAPFIPIGEIARWRMIYHRLQTLEIGDTLTYEDAGAILGLDPIKERPAIQQVVRQAQPIFLREDNRALDAVRNVGYRVVEPGTQLVLAQRHQAKSGRSLRRGHQHVVHVDFNEMEPNSRKAIEVLATAMAAQIDFNKRLTGRQEKLEKALAELAGQSTRTEDEIAQIKADLARLTAKLDTTT
jgi:hypothetical protein